MKDKDGTVIYVGKAKHLKQRVRTYFQKNQQHSKKVQRLIFNIADFEVCEVDTELDALLLECSLIQRYHPLYNHQMNNSQNYCFITLTKTGFTTATQSTPDSFGPFRQYKKVPQSCQILSELYQMPWLNSITRLKLASQNPQMCERTIELRLAELKAFFTTDTPIYKQRIDEWLQHLIEEEAFEQAALVHQQARELDRFYTQAHKIKQFIHSQQQHFALPMPNNQLKHYQLSFGQIVHTSVLPSDKDYQPTNQIAQPLTLDKKMLDPALITLSYIEKNI